MTSEASFCKRNKLHKNSPAFLLKSGTWQEFPIFDTSIQQILEVLIKAVRQEKKTHKLENFPYRQKKTLRIPSITPKPQIWPTLLLRAGSVPLEAAAVPSHPACLQKTEWEGSRHTSESQKVTFIFQTILLKCAKITWAAQMYEQEKKKRNHMYNNF